MSFLLKPARARFLVFIALLGFFIRFGAVVAMRNTSRPPGLQMGQDGIDYHNLGESLAHGRGFARKDGTPTSFRAPGFPFLLAGLYLVPERGFLLVYVVLCLLGAMTCVLTYFLGTELFSEAGARLAALLMVFYFPHIYFATVYASENAFIPVFALSVYCVLRLLKTPALFTALIAGLTMGYAVLTRPFAILCLPLLALVILWKRVSRAALAAFAVFCVVTLAVTLSWSWRNFEVQHAPVFATTNGGSTFYGGNNDVVLHSPKFYGSWLPTAELPGGTIFKAAPSEVARDHEEWTFGENWVKEHLAATPLLVVMKLARFWLPEVSSGNRLYVLLDLLTYTPYLLLIIWAAIMGIRNRGLLTREWAAVHAAFAATLITAVLFWGSPRFRDANAPLLVLYATFGLTQLIGLLESRGRRKA
ncbi:MAG: ArnT family glycosyltransferase [Candidatus Acidiferrales bacterium]